MIGDQKAQQIIVYSLFTIILLSTLALYYFISPGISMRFDDSIYAYSAFNINSLQAISWGSVAYGFAFLTLPFYVLLNHSVFVTKYVCLFSLAVTMVMLFLIGKMYKSDLAGMVASIFYAFNPLTMAFSIRYLPDPFIAMVDSIGIALAVYGAKSNKKWVFILSAFFFGSGIFFGNQAAIGIIAFLPFVPALWYSLRNKESKKRGSNRSTNKKDYLLVLFYSILGLSIIGVMYFGSQFILYHNPFYGVNGEANFFETEEPNCYPSYLYYFYILFPIRDNFPCVITAFSQPYANLSILSILFIASSAFLILKARPKKKSIIMPFIIFFIVFFLYTSFGSESITHYLPLQEINRVLLPLALVMAIGSSVFISKLKNLQSHSIVIGIVILYLAISYMSYNNIYSIYNSHPTPDDWNITYSVIHNFGYLNLSTSILYENYTNIGDILCMSFNKPPKECYGIPMPQINCHENNIFVLYLGSKRDICPNSTGMYYYNATYGYNVYMSGR